MSTNLDKRRRNDLDIFVLALIDGGVSTPYEMQKAADLSQGATVPTLQRLTEARLVRPGRPGPRGRIGYQVSAAGKRLLKDGWRTLIDAGPSGDPDSDLRVALLTILGGGDHGLAVDFLRRSADNRSKSIGVEEQARPAAVSPLARWYTDLRSGTTKMLQAAESEAIRAMADTLPRKLSDKSAANRSPVRKRSGR